MTAYDPRTDVLRHGASTRRITVLSSLRSCKSRRLRPPATNWIDYLSSFNVIDLMEALRQGKKKKEKRGGRATHQVPQQEDQQAACTAAGQTQGSLTRHKCEPEAFTRV